MSERAEKPMYGLDLDFKKDLDEMDFHQSVDVATSGFRGIITPLGFLLLVYMYIIENDASPISD